jgi:hypothetical protein
MGNSRLLDAALTYADFGWTVFPAPPGEKKSYKSEEYSGTKWGQTNDPGQIVRDWKKWPDANIGLPCGRRNNIFVVEVDNKVGSHSANGFIAFAELQTKYGKPPDTLQAISPSGSLHSYFNYPEQSIDIHNSTNQIGLGIDVRGEGGMVIVPPSQKGDKRYRWHNLAPIADAPSWLIDLAKDEEPREEESSTPIISSNGHIDIEKTRRALKVVARWLDGVGTNNKIAAVNVRHKWLNVLSILRKEFSEAEAFQLALEFSSCSRHFKGDRQFRSQWKTIAKDYNQNIGTLYYWASQAEPGWNGKRVIKITKDYKQIKIIKEEI